MYEKSKYECTCVIHVFHMIEYPENSICIFLCVQLNLHLTMICKYSLNVNLELPISCNREYINSIAWSLQTGELITFNTIHFNDYHFTLDFLLALQCEQLV